MDRHEAARSTAIPGVEVNFSQPIRDNVNENIAGQYGQIALKIYGDDLTVLQQQAERAKNALADVPGVADLGIVKSGELRSSSVKPDREALGALRPRSARCRTPSRPRSAATGRRATGRARRASTSCCGSPTVGARRRRGDPQLRMPDQGRRR